MAKGTKKKKKELTIEEKLEQALVPEEEWPYEVPENWCWTYIQAGFDVSSSKRVHKKDWLSEGIPFYRTRELVKLSEYGYVENELFISQELYRECKEKYGVPKVGDLLISGVGTIGVPYIVEDEKPFYFKDGNVIWFQNKGLFLPRYIFHLYKGVFMYNQIHNKSAGTTVDTYTIVNAKKTVVPLPPLAEQQRIVDRIESLFAKLDEAKEKAQAVVDGFEDRKAAILHKAFTGELTAEWREKNLFSSEQLYQDIQHHLSAKKKKKQKKVRNDLLDDMQKKISKDWLLVDLDSISTQITDGEHKTPNRVDSYCGYYLLSARNIHDDELRLEDVDYIDGEEYSIISRRCNPKRGDILLSCSGSVGRCCVVNDDNLYCMVRSAAMIIQHGCNSRFIMYMIQSDAVHEQIRRLTKQTAQANLFLGAIASLAIPLPSKEEQDEIAKRLDDLMLKMKQSVEIAEQVVEQIDIIKKSILARAFCGDLGTNDPTDENAEELLKRVL